MNVSQLRMGDWLVSVHLSCVVVWPPTANSGDRSARRSEHVYVRARAQRWHDARRSCQHGTPCAAAVRVRSLNVGLL
jgi:hypothetical protein